MSEGSVCEDVSSLVGAKRSVNSYVGHLTRICNSVEEKMTDVRNCTELEEKMGKLEETLSKFNKSAERCLILFGDEVDERRKFEEFVSQKLLSINEFKERFETWRDQCFLQLEKDLLATREKDVKAGVGYDAQSVSSRSSVKKKAIAKLKLEQIKHRQELQKQLEDMRRKEELMAAQHELALAELEDLEDDECVERTVGLDPPVTSVPGESSIMTKGYPSEDISSLMTRMANVIAEGFSLPTFELVPFDGDPLKFITFMKDFQANVESRTSDDGKKLSLLVQ